MNVKVNLKGGGGGGRCQFMNDMQVTIKINHEICAVLYNVQQEIQKYAVGVLL
jgi:hypothetical protein